MSPPKDKRPTKAKTLFIFILTIILGYGLFILPDIFFGITKINGGKIGLNLLFMALFQCLSIVLLLKLSLHFLGKSWKDIGWEGKYLAKDISLGLLMAGLWTLVQFAWLIPSTGGAERADIQGMLSSYDGTWWGTLSFVALGVIGGGFTEELFNRGYFINVLKEVFNHPTVGLWIASLFSILTFALGHMPSTALDWMDILIPTLLYTLLFIYTKRLTASMVAHGVYNMSAILLVYYLYY